MVSLMAIGVSYMGSDGSNSMFDLEGVPGEGTMAAGLLGAQSVRSVFGMGLNAQLVEPPKLPTVGGMSEGGDGKVSIRLGDWPGYLSDKIRQDGGLEIVGNMLQVKGFDRGQPSGTVYGCAGGQLGFHSLEKIDPVVGEVLDVVEDVEAKLEPETKSPTQKIVLKKKVGVYRKTAQGRINEVKHEQPKKFFEMDVPYTRYGVRFGFEFESGDNIHPTGVKWLAFGDEFSLSTLDGEETIDGKVYGKFNANTKALSQGKEPPVKVISGELLGGGKYGVKPTFNNGILRSLDFGTQKQLDEGWPENTVNTQVGCPYYK